MRKLFFALMGFLTLFAFSSLYAATTKQWTFLIYLNGKNSLDEFGAENIKSMEKIGTNDDVNVVVEWGSLASGKTVRMLIQKSTNPNKVTSPVLENLGSVDMGSYKTLQDFIKWGVEHYPAEHYFIDVWNHGSGWHLSKQQLIQQARTYHPADISWDDLTGNSITTEQLGKVMSYAAQVMGHKVDIYGSDACLMGMAEVADEMSDSVSYFVGSQELEPGAGWPYGDLLSKWQATAHISADQVAKILVDVYVKSYQGGSNGRDDVTFAAYDLSKLTELNAAVKNLGVSIQSLNASERSKALKAVKKAQAFYYSDYVDLADCIKKLSALDLKGLDPAQLAAVKSAVDALVIANQTTEKYAQATGLSIWIPSSYRAYEKRAQRYHGLKFNVDTAWGDALSALLQGQE